MTLAKTIGLTVTILCAAKFGQCQYYEADYHSFEHGSDSDDGPHYVEHSGFVPPLEYYPPYANLHTAESNAATNVFTIFPKKQAENPQDYFDNFGYFPAYAQGAASETVVKPQVHRGQSVQVERTQTTAKSSQVSRIQPQFEYETRHENFKKPQQGAPIKKFVAFSDDYLEPYKKYSFQAPGSFAPYQAFGGSDYPSQIQAAKLHRHKRYSNKKRKQKLKGKRDEYGYLADYRSRPGQFDDESIYGAPEFSIFGDNAKLKEYDYGADVEYGLDEYERIKSVSEKEASEASKDPANCVEVKRESMTCKVCTNPKTGGNYESCSYVSEPKNNKYAYVKEHKFDSKDDPNQQNDTTKAEPKENAETVQNEETQAPPQTAPAASSSEAVETKPQRGSAKYQQDFINIKPQKPASGAKYQNYYSNPQNNPSASPSTSHPTKYSRPTKYTRAVSKYGQSSKYVPPQPVKYAQPAAKYTQTPKYETQSSQPAKYTAYSQNNDEEEEEDDEDDEEEDEDDEEDESEEREANRYSYGAAIPDFFSDNEPKKNVEHVLAEFARKDRSACTKSFKKGMTCYECTGKTGLKHEECMFVSESAPKSSHLAYKELKEFNTKPEATTAAPNGNVEAESKVVSNSNPAPSTEASTTTTTTTTTTESVVPKRKSPFKKYNPDEPNESKKISSVILESTTTSSRSDNPIKRHVKRSAPAKEAPMQVANLKEKSPSSLSSLDEIADPNEFVEESKGAFWADTVPKYSKELGLSLPKYMLAKSEHEAFFDDFLGRG